MRRLILVLACLTPTAPHAQPAIVPIESMTVDALMAMAGAHREAGELQAAVIVMARVIEAVTAQHGPAHRRLAHVLNEQGSLLVALDRDEEAAALFARALAIVERTAPGDRHERMVMALNLGSARFNAGFPDDAQTPLREGLRLWGENGRPPHPPVIAASLMLADLYLGEVRHAEARQVLRRVRRLALAHPELRWPWALREVRRLLDTDAVERARARVRSEMRHMTRQGARESVAYGQAAQAMASTYEAQGRYRRALRWRKTARQALIAAIGAEHDASKDAARHVVMLQSMVDGNPNGDWYPGRQQPWPAPQDPGP